MDPVQPTLLEPEEAAVVLSQPSVAQQALPQTPAVLRLAVQADTAVQTAVSSMREGYKAGGTTIEPAEVLPETGCLVAQKAANKAAGFGWVKMKVPGAGARKEYYVHHLAYLAGQDLQAAEVYSDVEEKLKAGYQFSHRCHQPRCFQDGHIILENSDDNKARTMCKGWTWVCCPGCKDVFNPCPHEPQCILPKTGAGWTSWKA